MSNVIGIGARPLRKEDRRFLTGRGNYVADIKRPDMVAGVFVRSPHAHAEHQVDRCGRGACACQACSPCSPAKISRPPASADLPCGWGITGKDGLPMKEPPHPALAQGKVRHVGDPVAFVVAETLEQAQRGRRRRRRRLRGAAGGGRRARRHQARRAASCSTTCRTTCAAIGRLATRLRPTPLSARRRMSRASAWSTTGWSAIRWSRARRSPNTMRRPASTRSGRRASFRMSCAC